MDALEPGFTYVVPAYNATATLGETLESIRAQTVTDWKCVIVDDGSTDATYDLAKRYEALDDRFIAITQENRGTGGAYNTGVRASTTEWVVICSSDDVLVPEHLRTTLRAIERRPWVDIVAAAGWYWYEDGSRAPAYPEFEYPNEKEWTLIDVLSVGFYAVGAAYRRSVFDRIDGYNEAAYLEDYDFWIRAMIAGARQVYLSDRLSLYRISDAQKSSSHFDMLDQNILVIQEFMDSGLLDSVEKRVALANIARLEELKQEYRLSRRIARRVRRAIVRIARFAPDPIWRLGRRVVSATPLSRFLPPGTFAS